MRRPTLLAALVTVALLPLVACGRGGDDGYELTAVFESTVGLYPSGDVHLMGQPIGHVDDIEIDGTTVRVTMTIDGDVPLPDDVGATIGQTQLIGERNVVLHPPWNAELDAAGASKARDGDVIPVERTEVPVEPDEGLQAFNELARSLDAEVVDGFVADSADVLEGRGEQLGAAIDQAAGLGTTLAEVDQQLVDAADNLHLLAGSLAERDEQLGSLVDRFSEATGVLSSERESIRAFLASLVELTDQGQGLLDTYGEQLPGDLASATALASILQRNVGSAAQLISVLPVVADGIARAYRPDIDGLFLRANITPTVQALLDALLGPVGQILPIPEQP